MTEKGRGIIPCLFCFIRSSDLPRMSAVMAHTHLLVLCLQFLPFRRKNLDNQCRDSQEKPLNGKPPPTDAQPPQDATVLCYQLRFCNHLDIHIFAFAFRTGHLPNPLSKRWLHFRTHQNQKQSVRRYFSRMN